MRHGWLSRWGATTSALLCIVPALRGKENDRRPGDILREITALVDEGALQVTLLGQNVNSYGTNAGGSSCMPVTPSVFCAVSATTAVMPCPPQRAIALMSV
jgi:hypothetical protein